MTITIDDDEGSPLKITNPFTVRTGDRYFFGGECLTQTISPFITVLVSESH